ncbi:DNA internalization-related competence protein ComEC/Rec2 [Alkalicoccus halolimnae]|uniref:DNA internalization-related competence protein ComEC/Rec2 n=1 Tax=Alkalicoccus halolimnae TaxID=1667239 RepID=A0AAJ8LYN6_9BACI|nr:DNA internalization-related competence protein ComEC/Rec2 [Alkalicoccus halolimnae]
MYLFFYIFVAVTASAVFVMAEEMIWNIIAFTVVGVLLIKMPNRFYIFIAAAAAYFSATYAVDNNFSVYTEDTYEYSGYVKGVSPTTGSSENFKIDFLTEEGERLLIYAEQKPETGSRCFISGKTSAPDSSRSPYQFDYQDYLFKQQVHWQVFSDKVSCTDGSFFGQWRDKREEALVSVGTAKGEGPPLAAALVFGDRKFIDRERIEQYQNMGVIHLLAVSGLHVGLITTAVWFLMVRIGLTKETAALLLIIILPFYMLFAGGAPSVLRAGSMTMIGLLFVLMNKKIPLFEICSITGSIFIFINPYIVYHIGFQLSFGTTLALLLSRRMLKGSGIRLILKVTLCAQLASLPFILYYFHSVSILTLAANIFFIPLISFVILPLSFAGVFASGVWQGAAAFMWKIMDFILGFMHFLLDFLESLPYQVLPVGALSAWMLLLLFISVYYIFKNWTKASAHVWTGVAALTFLLTFSIVSPYFDNRTYVHFLDVGQGDAALIELPNREAVYLIDTGGETVFTGEEMVMAEFGPGERTIIPFMKSRGITKVDKMILSHGHADHIGEVCTLTEKLTVSEVLYPAGEEMVPFAEEQIECLKEKEIPTVFVEKGDHWIEGEHSFEVIHPSGAGNYDENNQSIVLRAVVSETSLLFTGDIETLVEEELVRAGLLEHTDILKVAHHGSKTSSSRPFLEAVSPKVSVIQAGVNNRHGHPHEEIVQNLLGMNSAVFRNDQHGTVTFIIDEGKIYAIPYIKEKP